MLGEIPICPWGNFIWSLERVNLENYENDPKLPRFTISEQNIQKSFAFFQRIAFQNFITQNLYSLVVGIFHQNLRWLEWINKPEQRRWKYAICYGITWHQVDERLRQKKFGNCTGFILLLVGIVFSRCEW